MAWINSAAGPFATLPSKHFTRSVPLLSSSAPAAPHCEQTMAGIPTSLYSGPPAAATVAPLSLLPVPAMDSGSAASCVARHLEQLLEHIADPEIDCGVHFNSFYEMVRVVIAWGAFDWLTREARSFYPDPVYSGAAELGRWLGDLFFSRTSREWQEQLSCRGSWRGHLDPYTMLELARVGSQILADNGGIKPHRVLAWFAESGPLDGRVWIRYILMTTPDLYRVLLEVVQKHPLLASKFAAWRNGAAEEVAPAPPEDPK